MKDLFSKQSADYSRYRPTYPPALFSALASLCPARERAWDCGTGSGQAAVALADYFESVVATDPSAKQITHARKHPKVRYSVGSAEKLELPDHSVDLVCAAQAFHWFKKDAFFAEARRVLKPGGVIAFWSYAIAHITAEVDTVVERLYNGILGPYWEKERKLVEEGYRDITLPFEEIRFPAIEMSASWSLEHLVGYLRTWSALQTYIQKNDIDPLDDLLGELQRAWGDVETRPVRWPLAVRAGRVTAPSS